MSPSLSADLPFVFYLWLFFFMTMNFFKQWWFFMLQEKFL